MGRQIGHFEIIGKDAGKLHSFYRELFDWEVGPDLGAQYGHYALVDQKSAGLGGGIGQAMAEAADGKTYVTVYVAVPDPQAALDKAVALGGTVMMPVMTVMEGVTIALFADPSGNPIGLMKG